MKKLFYSGLTALMMLFAFGSAKAQDLTSPTFTLASGEITPNTRIEFTLPSNLNVAEHNGAAFILYVENKSDVTLETTADILFAAAQEAMGGGTGGYAENGDTYDYEIAVYYSREDDGSGVMPLKPVTISTESGSVAFQARLAVIGEDEDGDPKVLYSEEMTANYTVAGEAVVVKPTAPTFSLEEGTVDANATLTLSNGYTDMQASLHPMYYVIDGAESDFTSVTNMSAVESSNLQDYTEGDEITITRSMVILAGTAEIDAQSSDIVWSDIIRKKYVVETTPDPEVQKVLAPTFNPRAGEVEAGSKVAIVSNTPDATVYYRKGETGEYAAYTAAVAISEACTLYAFATKTGMNNSDTVSAAYTIVAVPEDEAGAPEITFDPTNADSVDNNTEILLSGIDGYSVEYGTYATIADAKESYYGDVYGVDGYPKVTVEEPILKIFLVSRSTEEEYIYYRAYKVRAASDVPMPTIMSENAMGMELGLYPKGDKVRLIADEADAIWYTTDGSKPAIDGVTSTKIDGDAGQYELEASVTIKAIAVKDGKASDVAVARFKLIGDATATLSLYRGNSPLDSIAGKNSPISVSFVCEESPYLSYMYPYTVYYTTDGVTEPSKEAYTENGNIKKSETPMGEWGPEGNPSVLVPNEGATTIMAKAYLHLNEDGLDEWIITPVVTVEVDSIVYGLENPEFSVASGEVRMGDTIRIKNPNVSEPEESEDEDEAKDPVKIFFSLNGPQPSSDMTSVEPTVVYQTDADEDVVIVIKEDAQGTYAYVPGNEKYYDGSDKIYFEGELKVQAICYDMIAYGTGMWGRPGQLEYGSDFVEASYSVMKDFPRPVITPDGGMVRKGTEVTMAAGEGLEIYYTVNDSVPEVGKTFTTKYENPIVVNEAMTVKAIAFKAKTGDEGRDSLSGVAVAVFTLIPDTVATPTFSLEEGVVEAGAEVELACTTQGATIYYTLDGTVPTRASEVYSEAIVIEETTTIKAIAMKEGMAASKVASATYEVEQEVIDTIIFTFKPAPGQVKDSTKVTIEFSRELGEDEMVFFKTFATKAAAEAYADDLMLSEGNGYGEPDEEEPRMGYPVITKAAPVLKVGYIMGYDEEGAPVFSYVVAEYTVTNVANEANELAGVSIYPNPTDGEFSVVAPANAQVEIFTAAGVLVKRMVVAEGNAQVRLDNSGIYFVRVRANGQAAIRKVVVR